jgi:molybdopterin converting factor small subunit
MQITVKLFANFRHGRFNIELRQYQTGITVGQIVEELGIPKSELGILLVNSRHVGLDHELHDGDILALFPLVGGG